MLSSGKRLPDKLIGLIGIRSPLLGNNNGATCLQFAEYSRSLALRFVKVAAALSRLTGWDLTTIKTMSVNGQKIE